MSTRVLRLGLAVIAFAASTPYRLTLAEQSPPPREGAPAQPGGRTSTRLPDGRWLIVGGEGAERTSEIRSTGAGTGARTPGLPTMSRAWHTATILPDGTVLIAGGVSGGAATDVPEIFDPATGLFTPLTMTGIVARSHHTATLLTDGRVLVAGGARGDGTALPVEIWDLRAHTATVLPQSGIDRSGASATLLADGTVRISGGTTRRDGAAAGVTVVDPEAQIVAAGRMPVSAREVARVAGSIPQHAATGVELESPLVVRFSDATSVETLTPETLALTGPEGAVTARVIAAEDGRLAFVWPATPLQAGSAYTLTIAGVRAVSGAAVPSSSFSFTTAVREDAIPEAADDEAWVPDAEAMAKNWRTNRPPSPWESLEPLQGPPGVTAISGRVLTLDGRPLADVTLEMNEAEARTDRTGRFLLPIPAVESGRHVLEIEGATASRGARRYGFFEYGMKVESGRTTVLPFTIWMPRLDTRHTVRIPSPTTGEVVVTTPLIPGLELHLPPQTTIRGEDGEVVTELSITPIPIDRPPFPLPPIEVPVYFTIQPGGAYVYTTGPRHGAQLVYPNYRGAWAGKRIQFYHYEPDEKGWYVYGLGTVTANERQVVPDARTRLYEFTGAMINSGPAPPPDSEPPGDDCGNSGDPVNLWTGLFELQETDLAVADVLPLTLTRTYRTRDLDVRPFGIGTTHPYAMFLWSAQQYQEADLVLPDGARIHYVRTSEGTGFSDAEFAHIPQGTTTATPTAFYNSTLVWNGNGWDLKLKDGTVYVFGDVAPLQSIRDRFGNTIRLTWSQTNGFGAGTGNLLQVTSPNGRWIRMTYDTSNRITQAADNAGRAYGYTYDAGGRLWKVTDPLNHVTEYTYDTSHRMLTVKNRNGVVSLTNEYETTAGNPALGWVKKQTFADGGFYQYAYTISNGKSTQTDVTDPRGYVRRVTFNTSGYTVSDIRALGTAAETSTSSSRQSGTNLINGTTSASGVQTTRVYDGSGNVSSTTEGAGTPNPVTTTYTYDPRFNEIATITNSMNEVTTYTYDDAGNLASLTDPLNHTTTYTYSPAGQLLSTVDALNKATTYEYSVGDLVKLTDPLNRVTTRFMDAAGRTIRVTDPMGRVTSYEYDALDRITRTTDPSGASSTFEYSNEGELLVLTDARGNRTLFTYDAMGRLATRTDPLLRVETFEYDLAGNLIETTDQKQQVTTRTYDPRNRLSQITYADSATVTYTYDDEDRVTQVVDSVAGTTVRTYDGFGHLLSETTPQGTITYTYDTAGRRVTTTVAGQPTITYTYDDAGRLEAVTQGTTSVSIGYDSLNRRASLTLPNGIVATYTYDDASQLTNLSYSRTGTAIGELTYVFDAAGNRIRAEGTWARTILPQPVSSTAYDAANQLTQWGPRSYSYDLNGNLASDGLTSYDWNARNQLAGVAGAQTASFGYRSEGLRSNRSVQGTATSFLYDREEVIQESVGGAPTRNRITGDRLDEALGSSGAGGSYVPLVDALGSVVALTDSAGAVVAQWSYEPYGRAMMTGSNTYPYQFTGRENDGTGLYYHRARYYSPDTGRFMTVDPVGFGSGPNLYTYAGANPVNASDPLGLTIKSNWTFFWEWVFEGGSDQRSYGQGSVEWQEMSASPGAAKMRRDYKAQGCPASARGNFGTIEAYFKTAWMVNSTAAQVGGFVWYATKNGNCTVTYTIKNTAGAYSFFLHVPVIPRKRPRATETIRVFGDINQVFTFTEPVPCCQGR